MESCITYFKEDISEIGLPTNFDFPFYYTPHPLAVKAAQELQEYLVSQTDWYHDFGMQPTSPLQACGKMFGVLIVRTPTGKIGYLSAFSGKMAGTNVLHPFVPPVFDTLVEGDFYKEGEAELNLINKRVETLESDSSYHSLKAACDQIKSDASTQIAHKKDEIKEAKKRRDERRREASKLLSADQYDAFEDELKQESKTLSIQLKRLNASLKEDIESVKKQLDQHEDEIERLKETRREKSNALQRKIFEQFKFLNAKGEYGSLYSIFRNARNENPPAGAGDCAAPKLLHYAYENKFEPLCMAEFWWGRPPRNEVRKHERFYTSCRGKCEPILGHMLQGLNVQENPMLVPSSADVQLQVLYEDEHLVAIHKPHEFLSVPGKMVEDSVLTRMKEKYPKATGPLIVHRLDMSTSGILLIPLSRVAHKRLQEQFRKRTVHKTYIALLEGEIAEDEGWINLPLRVDLDDRPRQMVCYEYGKTATTKFKVLERKEGTTRVQFHPLTGRTHQLRVHAAHVDGLNAPIIGDDLYGTPAWRLYLHAEQIEFDHPTTKDRIALKAPADW